MFFYVSWGTKVRQDERGTVADRCPTCDRVRRFAVTEHFSSFHLYHIPLGGWKHEATVMECFQCASRFYCDPNDFDDVMPEDEAGNFSLGELVERTNSRLLRAQEVVHWQPEGVAQDGPILTALPVDA